MLIKFKFLIIFLFVLLVNNIFSQNFTIKHFPPQVRGLSANCSQIIQDSSGYLWIATNDGLCRFDGDNFKLYTTDDGLLRPEILCLEEGSNGDLWVCTKGGISLFNDSKLIDLDSVSKITLHSAFANCYYDNEVEKLHLVNINPHTTPVTFKSLKDYYINDKKISLKNYGCITSSFYHDSIQYQILKSINSQSLISIKDMDTTLLFSNKKQINDFFVFENTLCVLINNKITEVHKSNIEQKRKNLFFNIQKDNIKTVRIASGEMYFISSNVLYHYDGFETHKVLEGKNFNSLNSLFVDRENIIWVCTGNGIVKVKPSLFTCFDDKHLLFGTPTKIKRDKSGLLWVSTIKNGLFYKSDSNSFFKRVYNSHIDDFILLKNDNILFSSIDRSGWFLGVYDQELKKVNKIDVNSDLFAENTLQKINKMVNSSRASFSKDLNENILVATRDENLILRLDNECNLIEYYGESILGEEKTVWTPSVFCHSNGDIWIRSSFGLKRIRNKRLNKFNLNSKDSLEGYGNLNGFYSFVEDKKGNLIANSDAGLTYIFLENGEVKDFEHFTTKNGLSENSIYSMAYLKNQSILLGTSRGLNKVLNFKDSLFSEKLDVKFFDKKNGLIGLDFFRNAVFIDNDSSVWMGTSEGLIRYLPEKDVPNLVRPKIFINEIKYQNTSQDSWDIINGSYDDIKQLINPFFYHYQNDLTFDVKAISTSDPKSLEYMFFLEGAENNWNTPTTAAFSRYNNLDPGSYVFKCKAIRTSDGVESDVLTYSFQIDSPYYAKPWFYITVVFGFGALIYFFISFREKQLKLINESLERKVKYRTKQLNKEKQKVEKQNELITKSISYAKRIQYSILPENQLMKDFFADHIIHYQPKDIVGGDFYWFRSFDDVAVIAAVDCTGHGVPGGFMSMMGSLLLDKIVQKNNLNTSNILADLNLEIIRVLRQESEDGMQDGMDLSICIIDKKKGEIHFSGARNGIYVIDSKTAKHYDADLLPVGGFSSKKSKETERNYTQHKIKITKDNWVFMYTDGYVDQLGGDQMRSLGMNLFLEAIQETVNSKSDKNRREVLKNKYDNWRKTIPPIDDVLIIGFKI